MSLPAHAIGEALSPEVRASLRAALPDTALVTTEEVAALLVSPVPETTAWLEGSVQPHGTLPMGQPLYRWREVLGALTPRVALLRREGSDLNRAPGRRIPASVRRIAADEDWIRILCEPLAELSDGTVVFERGRVISYRRVPSVYPQPVRLGPEEAFRLRHISGPTHSQAASSAVWSAGLTAYARAVRLARRALIPEHGPVAATSDVGPIANWRAVARVVGVDEDTIHRWKRPGDESQLPFDDADRARDWWRARRRGVSMEEARPKKKARRATPTGSPVDWKSKARGDR